MGTPPPHAELSLMHLEEGEWEEMKPCGVTKDRKKWWWPGKGAQSLSGGTSIGNCLLAHG